ncbi:helix-turn-helix domain-containing protein [Actinoalloteichus caeruleus]|uniref:helix-turn-helix domain-containing protein n=1 Tax=Actinoalloteichus cyanogriseus TaxID=2893586 RepID=UPI003AAB2F61
MTTRQLQPLWTVDDVADYLRIPVKTLYQWHWRGEGPPVRKIGRHLRYDPVQVQHWATASDGTAA